MVDINYVNGLPEATGTLTGQAYKVTGKSTAVFGLSSTQKFQKKKIFILHSGNLTLSGETPEYTYIYLMGTLTVNSTLKLGRGSYLIFGEGGYVAGSGTLTADGAMLEAPIAQIFSSSLTVNGTWNIEQTYPKWFTSEIPLTYYKENAAVTNSSFDWAVPINQAIKMKGVGTVFIPKGIYTVKQPIDVNGGIILKGANGININGKANKESGTILAKMSDALRGENDYMIKVNTKYENTKWVIKTSYLTPITSVEGIRFEDISQTESPSTTKAARCIIVSGSATFRNLSWSYFKQGIKWGDGYADNRLVSDCVVNNYFTQEATDDEMDMTKSSAVYFFDVYGNGENLVVQRCACISNPYHSLRIGLNSGATIRDNIFNNPVHIKSAKAVRYSSNHMENGHISKCKNQLVIFGSTVHIDSCYFEKGDLPSIQINRGATNEVAIVTATNNSFVATGGKREAAATTSMTKQRIENMADYDITIDQFSNLVLSNNYRYDLPQLSAIQMSLTFGIAVATFNNNQYVPMQTFNEKSHLFSQSCNIMGLEVFTDPIPTQRFSECWVGYAGITSWCRWVAEAGSYVYKYAILAEDQNPEVAVLKNVENNNTTHILTIPSVPSDSSDGLTSGVYLQLLTRSLTVRRVRLLLERSQYNTQNGTVTNTKRVIIPVCGSQIIYDNGVSVAGFKWS